MTSYITVSTTSSFYPSASKQTNKQMEETNARECKKETNAKNQTSSKPAKHKRIKQVNTVTSKKSKCEKHASWNTLKNRVIKETNNNKKSEHKNKQINVAK